MLLENGKISVSLSPQGAGLTGAMCDGRVFLAKDHPCFPLLPLGNRVEGNSFTLDGQDYLFQPNTSEPLYLHGDGWLAPWTTVFATPTRAEIAFDHLVAATSPHVYRANLKVVLEDAALKVSLSVTNCGSKVMPFGLGLHPFFPRLASTRITAPAGQFWSEGAGYLPGARGTVPASADFSRPAFLPPHRLNNLYEDWIGKACIEWSEIKLRLDLVADPVFKHLMVYAPGDATGFFCLEPMTHLPNALALQGPQAMHLLAPGQTLTGGIRFSLSDME